MTAEIDSNETSHNIAQELLGHGLIHEVIIFLFDRGLLCPNLFFIETMI